MIGLFTTVDPQPYSWPSSHSDRMAVHRIALPPLRERSDDIPDLVRRIAGRLGLPKLVVSSDALQALMRSPWPGNVRQLAAVVRSAIAGRSCGTIGLADLPIDVIEGKASTFTTFEKAEYQAIVQALKFADGNKKVAAAELGIARSNAVPKAALLPHRPRPCHVLSAGLTVAPPPCRTMRHVMSESRTRGTATSTSR